MCQEFFVVALCGLAPLICIAMGRKKNPAAVLLGKLGGSKGGKVRAARLSPERRSEIARKAVLARWAKEKKKKLD